MQLEDLKAVNNVLSEIERLQKRSELLDKILSYYDSETGNFDIPAKWKGLNKISKELQPKMNPRDTFKDDLTKYLSYKECFDLGIRF